MKRNSLENKKVLLGLSGGVDSTAAALLLQQQGYEVTGLFFDVLGDQQAAKEKACKAADELGIVLVCRDVSAEFAIEIIDYFCDAYLNGKTPNPCVRCNPAIKFKTMEEEANRIGAAYLATGHYARLYHEQTTATYFIRKGISEKRDQSYMLYRLSQNILSRLLLPLGAIDDKSTVRDLVRNHRIGNAETKDSQEICFIQNENYIDFIEKRMFTAYAHGVENNSHGFFVDKEGRRIGEHHGILRYTIGQRKGLGMTFGKPMFVTAMNVADHTITLGENEDLFTNRVISGDNVFTMDHRPCDLPSTCSACGFPLSYEGKQVTAKIRYAAKPAAATIHDGGNGKVVTLFTEKQRAAAPGQSVVFYDGDLVIGGGIIS